jgi:AcrR family transcriptional regulator
VTQNSVGRPRNPAIDDKVLTAALEQFGEAGWAAFSVEAVARRAGVSKRSTGGGPTGKHC